MKGEQTEQFHVPTQWIAFLISTLLTKYSKTRKKIHKCFLEKNNKLKDAYLKVQNKGMLKNLKDGKHEVKIIVSDSYKITKDQKIGIIPPIGGG